MAKVNVRVEQPSGVVFPAGAKARLRLWLPVDATRGGALVTAREVVVDVPTSGTVDVELIPSTQLTGPDGMPVMWCAEVDWLDPDGVTVSGGHAEWGHFFIPEGGGALGSLKVAPASFGGGIHYAADMATANSLDKTVAAVGDLILVPGSWALNIYRKDA